MTRKYLPAVRSACGITFAVLITSAGAQLPTARLDSIFPPGLRGGTECEVTIGGTDLDDADRLLFSDAGLSATRVEGLKFKVTASAGMAPGLYEVRAAGRYGISASRLFAVGTIAEVNEPADNASPEKSFNVTPPVTINGTAGPEAGDHFRFKAAKDQRVLILCAAERIDSALNAVVTLSDAAGRELASAHRTQSGDASMDFTAPADGDYIVEVHDMAWQQGTYRLSIAPPEAAGSAAGPGMPLSGAVCDWMPASPPQEIKAPAPAASAAHKITLPGVVSGTGSQEWLEFTGEKNRRVMLDLLSHRLGQPSDWLLRVLKITRDDKGQEKTEQLAQFDDTPAPAGAEQLQLGSRDPSGSITCEEGVVYRLHLLDRFNARKPWRLVLRDPQPGFSLVSFSVSPVTRGAAIQRWSPLLRKGGTSLVSVAVLRRDGFAAPVTLRMEGLPAGVTANEVTVPADTAGAAMIVRAAPDAKSWNGRIRITGTSGELTSTAAEAIPRWSVGNTAVERLDMRLSRDGFVLAVTESETAPFAVEAAEPKVYETAVAGTLEIPVKFIRDTTMKGIKGEWEAVLMGMPGLRQAPVVKPAADAKDAKLILDLKNKDGNLFHPGTWTVHASARGTIQWQNGEKAPVKELVDAVYSGPITVKIEPSPAVLTAPAGVTIAPGGKVEVPLKIERRYGFAESLSVEFTPPAGVKGLSAEKLTIPKEAAEAKLVISAAADAAPGAVESQLNAKLSWNGQEVPWSVNLKVEVKP